MSSISSRGCSLAKAYRSNYGTLFSSGLEMLPPVFRHLCEVKVPALILSVSHPDAAIDGMGCRTGDSRLVIPSGDGGGGVGRLHADFTLVA